MAVKKKKGQQPNYVVKYPLDLPGKKTQWVTVGAGWVTKGEGPTDPQVVVRMNSIPLPGRWDGKLCLFKKD